MPSDKRRIDELLVERGLAEDRASAQRAIIAGEVRLADRLATTPGERISPDAPIEVMQHTRFVSRGGEKLAGALRAFSFDPSGMRCVDVGASTGGFTDCLLQAGAASVAAIDVGYGQLAWALRTDRRVSVFDRMNIRTIDPVAIGAPFDLVVADISFIPLRSALPSMANLLEEGGWLITLVKPQFEACRDLVGPKGVVVQADTHTMVVERALESAVRVGFAPQAFTYSPIRGPEGNIEFLLLARLGGDTARLDVGLVVDEAHRHFGV
jgi:23S rRNA (cytidine1920-2'-O)/16S rRNA (cytidine1409-2'-O)-methyltransferase